jgi:DNA-binding NarL/FixJ family response regulator
LAAIEHHVGDALLDRAFGHQLADRFRGIDVGANAYIVKSSFDQSNLLDVVRRLM